MVAHVSAGEIAAVVLWLVFGMTVGWMLARG